MTFSAEQRQGKQGENDTRFAVDFTGNRQRNAETA